ncbi:MAG: hypothetical protein JST39_05920, partial [Bacteroidetes bacterium]|nr:hypothetical protein [Bacteroidota bacterium]
MKASFTLLLLVFCCGLRAQQISSMEYFFDTDPGFGNGTNITINSAGLDSTLALSAAGMTPGLHTLYMRLKSGTGTWSTVYQSNVLLTNGVSGTAGIVSAEYFFDTDPGFGKGKAVAVNGGGSMDSTLLFSMEGLTAGLHTFYLRLLSNSGAWSTVYQSNVLVSSGAGTGSIVSAEYFYDTDPGIGKATAMTLSGGQLDSTLAFPVNGLAAGQHTLYVRLLNNAGQWSFYYSGNFTVFSGSGSEAISKLEYFFDADSGVNKNTIIPL